MKQQIQNLITFLTNKVYLNRIYMNRGNKAPADYSFFEGQETAYKDCIMHLREILKDL